MADFQAHFDQAKKNLAVLSEINNKIANSWDWQVTTCYYIAVHLVNGHLAAVANMHYSSHEKVKNALFNDMSPAKIEERVYLPYVKLENLSRRARYLCKDTDSKDEAVKQPDQTFLTYDVHLKKALVQVDLLIEYFSQRYGQQFAPVNIDCLEIKSATLKYFNYVKA